MNEWEVYNLVSIINTAVILLDRLEATSQYVGGIKDYYTGMPGYHKTMSVSGPTRA